MVVWGRSGATAAFSSAVKISQGLPRLLQGSALYNLRSNKLCPRLSEPDSGNCSSRSWAVGGELSGRYNAGGYIALEKA